MGVTRNGRPCKKCGKTERYNCNNACVYCTNESSKARRRTKEGKEYQRRYRQKHKDKLNRVSQEWIRNNPEKRRAVDKRYRDSHLAKSKEKDRNWSQNNKDKVILKSHRRRAKLKGQGSYTVQEWHTLCAYHDHRCLRCGRSEPEIKLTVDHVLPVSLGGSNTVENLQCLCGSCNSWKGNRHIDFRNKPPMGRWIQPPLL